MSRNQREEREEREERNDFGSPNPVTKSFYLGATHWWIHYTPNNWTTQEQVCNKIFYMKTATVLAFKTESDTQLECSTQTSICSSKLIFPISSVKHRPIPHQFQARKFHWGPREPQGQRIRSGKPTWWVPGSLSSPSNVALSPLSPVTTEEECMYVCLLVCLLVCFFVNLSIYVVVLNVFLCVIIYV